MPYPPGSKTYDQLPLLKCIQAIDYYDCMTQIAANTADIIGLEPGMAYTAGEYYTLMPLMAEKYNSTSMYSFFNLSKCYKILYYVRGYDV